MVSNIKNILISSLACLSRDDGPKVVFYHDVYDSKKFTDMGTPLSLLKQQVESAKNRGFVFVDGLPLNIKEVSVCFDDGFRGILDCKDELLSMGIRPTIFIAPALIGQDNYLNWHEILELQSCGFVFQSHTWSHKKLPEVPENELEHELGDAKKYISDKLSRPVSQLCFPQGRFNNRICDLALSLGYDVLFSSIPGNSDKRIVPGMVCRNLVQYASPQSFVSILHGGMNLLWKRYYKFHYMELNAK